MSSEWKKVSFAEAPFEIIDGDRGANYPKQHDFSKTGHCLFLSAGNVTKDGFSFSDCAFISETKDSALRKGKLKKHDLALTTRGTVGNVGYYGNSVRFQHMRINSGMVILRPDTDKLLPYYLYLFLRSQLFRMQMNQLISGSAQPQLPIRDLNRADIHLPPIVVQHEICEILGALDDRITLLRETNKTLESIAQAIFKSWFVDFDPVRAKMEGRQPEGMDEETAALFPDSFDNTELGLIPKGWSLQTLGQAYEINPFRKLSKGSTAKYLNMANVPTEGFSVDDVTTREFSSGSKFVLHDTLLARITPCLENGKTAYVDFLEEDEVASGSTEFIVLSPKEPLPPLHAYLLCRSPDFREYAIQSMSGTSGRQRIQNDMLSLFLIAIPPIEIAKKFSDICSSIQNRVTSNSKQAKLLSSLRDTLLPNLISGQLRLPEAQEQIEDALS